MADPVMFDDIEEAKPKKAEAAPLFNDIVEAPETKKAAAVSAPKDITGFHKVEPKSEAEPSAFDSLKKFSDYTNPEWLGSKAITALQKLSTGAVEQQLGKLVKPEDLGPYENFGKLSNAGNMLQARALQGANPFVRPDVLESDPRMQRGALDAEDVARPLLGKAAPAAVGAAAFASQIPGMAPQALLGGEGVAAEFAHPAAKFFTAAGTNLGVMSAASAAGAPEGQRAAAAGQALTDPKTIALSLAGPTLALKPWRLFKGERPLIQPTEVPAAPPSGPASDSPQAPAAPSAKPSPKITPAPLEQTKVSRPGGRAVAVIELTPPDTEAMLKQALDTTTISPTVVKGMGGETPVVSGPEAKAALEAQADQSARAANDRLVGALRESAASTPEPADLAQPLPQKFEPSGSVVRLNPDGEGHQLVVFGNDGAPASKVYDLTNPKQIHKAADFLERNQLGSPFVAPDVSLVDFTDHSLLRLFGHDEPASLMEELAQPQQASVEVRGDGTAVIRRVSSEAADRAKAAVVGDGPSPSQIQPAPPSKPPPSPPPEYNDRVPYPDAPKPTQVSTDDAADIVFHAKLAKSGILEAAKRQLIEPGLRGADYLRQYVQAEKSAPAIGRMRDELVTAMRKQYGLELRGSLDTDLDRYNKGQLRSDQMAEKYPDFWRDQQAAVDKKLAMVAQGEKELVEMGALPPENAIDRKALELYQTREFFNTKLPQGEWAKILMKEGSLFSKAVEGSKEWWPDRDLREQFPDVDPKVIRADRLMKLISGDDPLTNGLLEHSRSPKAFGALKGRLELPEWYRKVLGEETSGVNNMAATLAKQQELLARFRMYKEMAADPRVATRSPTQEQLAAGWQQVNSAEGTRWGDLAGAYVDPSIYDFVVKAPAHQAVAADLARSMLGIMKGHQVGAGGLAAYFNDASSGPWQAVMSSAWQPMDPASTKSLAVDQYRAVKFMREFVKDPTAETPGAQTVRDARRLGVDNPNRSATEVLGGDSPLVEIQKHFDAQPNDLSRIVAPPVRGYLKLQRKIGGAMDWYPRVQRMGQWLTLTERAEKNPMLLGGLNVDPADQASVHEAAMRWAADKVLKGNYTPERVSPAVQKLREGWGAALANRYVTWKADMLVKHALLPQRLTQEPELRKSMMQFGALMLGALSVLKYQDPLSKAERDAAIAAQGQGLKYTNPDSLIYFKTKDGKGHLLDPSQALVPLQWFAGDQTMPWYGRFADQMTLNWLDDGALGRPARALASKFVDPRLAAPDISKGRADTTLGQALDFMWKDLSLGPGVVPRTYQTLRSAGAFGDVKGQQPVSAAGTASRLSGLPIREVNAASPEDQRRALFDWKGDVKQLRGQMRSDIKAPAGPAKGPMEALGRALTGTSDEQAKREAFQKSLDALKAKLQQGKETRSKFRTVEELRKGEVK